VWRRHGATERRGNCTAWIESHQSLRKHPKLARLCNDLKITPFDAIGRLHIFWWWCIDYAPTGRLDKFDALQLADAAEWKDEPEKFVKALVNANFLDCVDGVLSVHDWLDFCGELVKQRCRRLKEKRRTLRHVLPSKPRHPTQPTGPNQPNPTQPTVVGGARAAKLAELEALTLGESGITAWAQQEFGVVVPEDVLREFKAYWREQARLRSDWKATLQNRIRVLVSKKVLTPARGKGGVIE